MGTDEPLKKKEREGGKEKKYRCVGEEGREERSRGDGRGGDGKGGEERKSENSGGYLKNFFVIFFFLNLSPGFSLSGIAYQLTHSENMYCTVTKCPISAQDN